MRDTTCQLGEGERPGMRAAWVRPGPSRPLSVSGHGTDVQICVQKGHAWSHQHPSPPCIQHTSALLAESVPSGGNIWSVTVTCQ